MLRKDKEIRGEHLHSQEEYLLDEGITTLTMYDEKTIMGTRATADDGLHEKHRRKLYYRCMHGCLWVHVQY